MTRGGCRRRRCAGATCRFDAIDKDQNGSLTVQELQAALAEGGFDFSLALVAHIIRCVGLAVLHLRLVACGLEAQGVVVVYAMCASVLDPHGMCGLWWHKCMGPAALLELFARASPVAPRPKPRPAPRRNRGVASLLSPLPPSLRMPTCTHHVLCLHGHLCSSLLLHDACCCTMQHAAYTHDPRMVNSMRGAAAQPYITACAAVAGMARCKISRPVSMLTVWCVSWPALPQASGPRWIKHNNV